MLKSFPGAMVFNRSLHDKPTRRIHLKNNNPAAAVWNNSTPISAAYFEKSPSSECVGNEALGKGTRQRRSRTTRVGEAASPPVAVRAVRAVETPPSLAYKEARKGSLEMDERQRSAAIERARRGGSC